MSQYNTVSPAEVGIMSGLMGAGIGYTIAPRKYNLEQLLTQKTIPSFCYCMTNRMHIFVLKQSNRSKSINNVK